MEKDPDVECGSSSSCLGNAKSKLDTLSKDDLIKFARKQMGLMQKLKAKCTDLEQKVEALKAVQSDTSNDSVIQELTERMDAVLVEKAETHQKLMLLHKENEMLKIQSEESLKTLTALQQKLDHAEKEKDEQMMLLEEQIKTIETKNKEELEYLEKLAKDNEDILKARQLKDLNSQSEAIRQEYEKKISDLEQSLELAEKDRIAEKETLQATHQLALQQTQEDIEHFQETISRLNNQHEDEIRYLEEQLEINATEFDIERERLLLIQEELSEQIALKESHLQDVQEEEEDLNRKTQKTSELIEELDSSALEDTENKMDKLKLALQDSQLQNAILKEELAFLSNVKTQLESDLKHLKDEFSVEREEMEFKINELQMTKEEGEIWPEKDAEVTICLEQHDTILRELNELHKAEMEELEVRLVTHNKHENRVISQEAQDLQNACKVLSEEKKAIASEYEHTKEILHNIQLELGDRTSDFVEKYNAMKEQATISIQELEEKLREKDSIIEKLKCFEKTPDESKHSSTSVEFLLVSNEEMAELQKDQQPVSKEWDALGKELVTKEEKLFELRKQVCYTLLHDYSVKTDEEEDVSVLLNRLLSRVEEDKLTCIALNEEKTQLQKDLQVVSEEKTQLQKDLQVVSEEKTQLQKDLQVVSEEKTQLQKDLQVVSEEKTQLQKDLQVVSEEKTQLQKDLQVVSEEKTQLQKELQVVSEEKTQLQKDLQVVSEEKTQLQKELQVVSEEKTQLQKDLQVVSEEKTQLQKELQVVSEEKTQLQKELQVVSEEKTQLQKDLQVVSEEKTQLQKELQVVSEEKTQLQKDLQVVSGEKTQLQKDLQVVSEEKTQLQNDLQVVSEEKTQLQKDLQVVSGEKTQLQKDLQVVSEEKTQLQNDLQVVSEEKTQLQKDLQVVSEERNDLKKVNENSERQLFDTQRHVCEILEQHYSIKVFSEEDPSVLLNQLLSTIQEEKKGYILLKEENIQQQRDLMTVVQERDDLRRRLEKYERELSDVLNNVREVLAQNYSVSVDNEDDVSVLLKHLESKIQDEKLTLAQQLEEKDVQLSQLQQVEVSDHGNVQKASHNEVLSDTENLQVDQTEQGEITESSLGQEHDARLESCAQETDDMKRLQQKLSEKESVIANLKEEISHIQEAKLSALDETTKQMELLENGSKEKEERLNKIKAVAVKARKELENSKKEACRLKEELEALRAERDKMSESMKAVIHGAEAYKNLMIDYDNQTELLDKEKEKLEASEKLLVDLNRRLHVAVEQNRQLSSEKENVIAHIETLHTNVRQLEAQVLEMHKVKSSMERDLESERLLKEQKTKECVCAAKEVEELHLLLQKQKHQLQQMEQELEQLRKDAQQSTLLDMEMADYERLVKDLNQQLSDQDRLLKEQERQTQAQREREEKLNQEIESLKSLVDIGEEKTAKVKQLLVKTKKDLADAKKEEASQMILQSSLKGELEAIQQQLETCKIQCSELTVDRHRLQEQLKSVSDQHQRSVTSYQHQVTALQDELNSTKAEFESTTSEFESYKVRVHNVLKQQKNKSSTQGDCDFSKQDRENMEAMLEQLRSKLQESQLNAKSCNAELQQLQTEYDTLLERHNKMLQQTITKEAELRERLLSLHSDNVALKSEHSESVAQLTAQTETLRSGFREQLHHVQDEHRSTVETLQQQINSLEAQLFQLQKEPAILAAQQQNKKPHSEKKLTDLPLFEMDMAREEGEGMETSELESVSTAGTPPPSLEQLLTSPDPKHEPFVWQVEPTKEELSSQLNTATRSMEHMNSLLHESEATNAILMEQINLLKSEMRRLERNQEREKSVANLEYLKNVLLQFIFLRSGSEKQALLPVIHTMLQLNPEEKSKLAAIAHGEEETTTSRGSGWTSYLHSWSGIR